MSETQTTTVTYVGGFSEIRVAAGKEHSLKRNSAAVIPFELAVKLHRQSPDEWQVNQDVRDVAFPKEESGPKCNQSLGTAGLIPPNNSGNVAG